MITLPKKYKEDINAFRIEVQKRVKQEDKRFEKLCKQLKIDPDELEGNCLFDYIFNDTKFVISFKDEPKR